MFIISVNGNDRLESEKIIDGVNEYKYCNYYCRNLKKIKFINHLGYMRIIILNYNTDFIKYYDYYICSFPCNALSKIISSDKYYLYDPRTIKKFNITVNSDYIAGASINGCTSILTWLINQKLPLKYDKDALNLASQNGQVAVLEWWKNSGLELKYNEYALNLASQNGQVAVLEWWKNSGLELKYSEGGLDYASANGHVAVLEWWKNSGLKLKYTENATELSMHYNKMEAYMWWKNNGLL